MVQETIRSQLRSRFINFCGVTLSTLLVTWPVIFTNKLFGDLLDARFTIVVNDHWYQVLTLNRSFADLGFYFPTQNQLGYSDGFLATGLLAIPARLVGFNALHAWVISNVVLIFVCLFFALKAMSRVFGSQTYGILVTVLIASSYPFLAQMGHLQTVGYLLVFPVIYFLQKLYSQSGSTLRNIFLIILLLEIMSLTSWYGFVFVLILMTIFVPIHFLIFGKKELVSSIRFLLIRVLDEFRESKKWKISALFVSLLPLPILWLKTYSVGFSSVGNKSYGEFVFYAPRWGDLFNSVNQSWGFQRVFNDATQQTVSATFERALGITPFLFIIAVLIFGLAISPSTNMALDTRRHIFVLLSTSLLPCIIVVTDEAGHSFWAVIWQYISPLRSIRVPFRISIITTWIVIFVIFYALSKLKVKIRYVFLVFLLLFADSWRPVPASWSQIELVSKSGKIAMETLKNANCEAFYIDPSPLNAAPWLTHVDAMMIASLTGASTINGYSGNWPDGWPIKPYWGRATLEEIRNWTRSYTGSKIKMCYMLEDKPEQVVAFSS